MWYSQQSGSSVVSFFVVNCFQNFIFMWYSQPVIWTPITDDRCELLSEFYLYVIFTANTADPRGKNWLWIAFRILSLCDIHSYSPYSHGRKAVVNCFQNFIFMWYSQLCNPSSIELICCELLSEFYLYVIFTAWDYWFVITNTLWIAFRILSLCDIHSACRIRTMTAVVVNCFQNFIFMWYSQPAITQNRIRRGCELLSEFYLYVIFTACRLQKPALHPLWIAFRILS